MTTNVCRLCLNPADDLLSIHSKYNGKYNLMDIMYELTLLEVLENDSLPGQICARCAVKLVDFHEFRQMLLDSHVKLLSANAKRKKGRTSYKINGENAAVRNKEQKRRSRTFDAPKRSVEQFICDICQRAFKRRSHIEAHLFGVHFPHLKVKVSKKQCPHCPRWFNDIAGRSNIARHIRTVHKDAGTRHKEAIRASPIIDLTQHIQCVHCDLHFSDSVQMYVHLQAHEQDAHERRGGYNFYCDDCEQDHSSLDAYAGHMDAVHQVRDGQAIRPFKCRWCGERFRRTQGLYSHVRRAHQCVDGILRTSAMIDRAANPNRATDSCLCIECGRLMSSPTALVAHLKTHNDDRPHKCHVCDATFKHVGGLKQHMATHTNERKYVCEVCQSAYKQVGHLTTHMMTHGIGIKRWYACKLCQKYFYNKGNYKEHMLVHEVTGRKILQCGSCFQRFCRRKELDAHTLQEHVEIEYA